ncbi:hypothetical protein BH10PLA1_BH10PLA1_08560 [soil metagenome]
MPLQLFWNGEVSLELPQDFSSLADAGGTASLRFGESATMMRMSRTRLEGLSAGDAPGREQVRDTAREHGATPVELDRTSVVTYDDTAQESDYLHGRCWLIGGHDHVVLLSCDMPEEEYNSPARVTIYERCDAIARSLTFVHEAVPKPPPRRKPPLPKKVPRPSQGQRPLTAKEEATISRFAEQAMVMLDRYAPDHEQGVFDRLDTAFNAWLRDFAPGRPSPDKAVREFGSLLGELLNGYFESRWFAANTGAETLLSVRHEHGATAVPFDLVRTQMKHQVAGYFARIRTDFERSIAGNDSAASDELE